MNKVNMWTELCSAKTGGDTWMNDEKFPRGRFKVKKTSAGRLKP